MELRRVVGVKDTKTMVFGIQGDIVIQVWPCKYFFGCFLWCKMACLDD